MATLSHTACAVDSTEASLALKQRDRPCYVSAVFVVALARLSGDAEAEAVALAKDLGTTTYEARLSLSGGFPALVLSTQDRSRATTLLGSLRARGHSAVACDSSAVVASSGMISMRRFELDDSAVIAADRAGDRLAYDDVLALLPALHKAQIESDTQTSVRKFSPGLALATGGLVMSKARTQASHATTTERERVLYIFRRSRQPPWILRENSTHYTALGASIAKGRFENFQQTVSLLRSRARRATYDEALLSLRRIPEHATVEGSASAKTVTISTEAGTDLMAHLLALIVAKRGEATTAYR